MPPQHHAKPIHAAAVKAMLLDGGELALIDLREELTFSQRHLLWARSVPLSQLELRFARLVPRRATRIVLVDDGDDLVERAAAILTAAGYADLAFLDGGVTGWERAGFELFSGVNVPSKAFGEHVEHQNHTPSISAEELNALMRDGTDMIVVDSRPFEEFQRVSIPTATDVPGAELALRIHDLAPRPETLVVVNCAGRTRSIIGAQSLINAGIPNKVVALRNGTMGWSLAGFQPDHGQNRRKLDTSTNGLARAKAVADRIAKRYGIERIDRTKVDAFRTETSRTLYLFDVRNPEEYAAGHVSGAQSAPGGQLVQATDQYACTLGARIVLIDDLEVRAVMTASWLRQMGWRDVFVLIASGNDTGTPKSEILGTLAPAERGIDAKALSDLLARNRATVVDLSLSSNYRKGHIRSAWFAMRSRLAAALAKIAMSGDLVLTSEDGVLARLAANDITSRYLIGGNAAWQEAGLPFSTEARMADEALDAWLKPYERSGDTKNAMAEYLAWETDLLPRIARDGTTRFATAD